MTTTKRSTLQAIGYGAGAGVMASLAMVMYAMIAAWEKGTGLFTRPGRSGRHTAPAPGDAVHPQERKHPLFRVSPEGRATAIIKPGTIFGEMVIVGHQMHDSFAEALDEVVVSVMSNAGVRRLLLGGSRLSAHISETLRRLSEIEQRRLRPIFKSVPERIASTWSPWPARTAADPLGRGIQVKLTHE